LPAGNLAPHITQVDQRTEGEIHCNQNNNQSVGTALAPPCKCTSLLERRPSRCGSWWLAARFVSSQPQSSQPGPQSPDFNRRSSEPPVHPPHRLLSRFLPTIHPPSDNHARSCISLRDPPVPSPPVRPPPRDAPARDGP